MHAPTREIQLPRPLPFADGIKRLLKATMGRIRRLPSVSMPEPAVAIRALPEVRSLRPHGNVTTEQLLRVAATALSFSADSEEQAVTRKAIALGLSLAKLEDFRQLPSGAVHCWVDGIATLVGSKCVVSRLGISVSDTPMHTASGRELLVAQGSRFLGSIQIS